MNKLLPLVFLAILALSACSGPSGNASTPAAPPKPVVDPVKPADFVENIKALYAFVNDNKGNYREVVQEYGEGNQSGKFIVWMDGTRYARLREEMYDDHGPVYIEYYFQNDRCAFIFEHSELDEIASGTTHVTEDRYYLNAGVLLLHYNKRHKFAKGEARDMSKVPNEEMIVNGEEDGAELEFQVNSAVQRFEELGKSN